MDIIICIQVYVNQSTVNLFKGWTNGYNLWCLPYNKRSKKKLKENFGSVTARF